MSNRIRGYIALAISCVVFNVIVFAIPAKHGSAFWVAYIFTDIAFILQIAIWEWTFARSKTLKSLFLKMPITYIGVIYLIIQIIAFVLCTALQADVRCALITCVIVTGISAILMVSGDLSGTEIKRAENHTNEKIKFMKSLSAALEFLAVNEKDNELKAELEKLTEKARFSDPTSSAATAAIDEELSALIAEFKGGIINSENIATAAMLIEQRGIVLRNNRQED